jgi:hypothetical protein
MEALSSSETSVLTRATRRNSPEDAILHIHSIQSAHKWLLGCQSYVPAALYAHKHLVVLISVTGWVIPQAHSAAGRIM